MSSFSILLVVFRQQLNPEKDFHPGNKGSFSIFKLYLFFCIFFRTNLFIYFFKISFHLLCGTNVFIFSVRLFHKFWVY